MFKIIKFFGTGLISLSLIIFLSFILNSFLMLSENLSTLFALIIAFVLNFFLITFFVFKAKQNNQNFLRYTFISLFFRTLEYVLFFLLNTYLNTHFLMIIFCVLIISFFLKFFTLNRILI